MTIQSSAGDHRESCEQFPNKRDPDPDFFPPSPALRQTQPWLPVLWVGFCSVPAAPALPAHLQATTPPLHCRPGCCFLGHTNPLSLPLSCCCTLVSICPRAWAHLLFVIIPAPVHGTLFLPFFYVAPASTWFLLEPRLNLNCSEMTCFYSWLLSTPHSSAGSSVAIAPGAREANEQGIICGARSLCSRLQAALSRSLRKAAWQTAGSVLPLQADSTPKQAVLI